MIFNQDKKVKRFAVYVFHDKDGIVDDYVSVFLKELKSHVNYLLVVVNGLINDEGCSKLDPVCDEILIRENAGYDITAYKTGLAHMRQKDSFDYDEYILANSTLFGPIYPFEEMFYTMNLRDVDFWGITKHHSVDYDVFGTCKYGYVPEHIQSSFLVIRSSLFNAKEYKEMWANLPEIHSYAEAIGFFEVIFTKDFNDFGFTSDAYVNTDDLEGYTRYPLMMMSHELIKHRKCPVIKQKSFSQNYYDILTDTVGNCTIDSFEFIRDHTDYDVNLILDNVIRTCNMADIKDLMHFNYILPQDYIVPNASTQRSKIALIMHLYYPSLADNCIKYAKSMPSYSDLIITVSTSEMYEIMNEKVKALHFNKIEVLLIENKGRDVSSLLVAAAPYVNDYDYICFMHDKKTTQTKPYANGDSFSYKCFENCLANENLVENIILTFNKNPRLGMLMPPPPNHGNFYMIVGTEWASNYDNTRSLAYRLNLKCNVVWQKEPIAPLGTMFWFRPKALKTLFDAGWTYDDFPPEPNGYDGSILHAIERLYGFVVQHEGYYPAWVMTDKFARIEFTNLHFMLRELNKELLQKYFAPNLLDMVQKLNSNMKFVWSKNFGFYILARQICPAPIWNILRKIKHTGYTAAKTICPEFLWNILRSIKHKT